MTAANPLVRESTLAPNTTDWFPVRVAAQKLGLNCGALRRRCAEKLAGENLARQINGIWFISPAADPRLRSPQSLQQRDLQQLAELEAQGVAQKYLAIARQRRDLVAGLAAFRPSWARRERDRRAAYLAERCGGDVSVPSITTFYKWEAAYEHDGIRGLVPEFGFRDRADASDCIGESALERIETILTAGNKISIANAIRLAELDARKRPEDPAWKIPSYRSVCRALETRRPQVLATIADKGSRAAQANHVPKLKRDYERIAAGDEYCGDERTVDLWVRVLTSRGWRAIRPKLTAWQDMRSRMIVGWIIAPHADSRTILGSLKLAIRAYGKPHILRTDWGEDYKAAARHGEYRDFDGHKIGNILDELGISVKRVLPYAPWSKPIESFFRAHKNDLDRLFAGFTGGCPAERHEDRTRWIKQNLEKLPTLDDLATALASFFDAYHHRAHSAADLFGKTPAEAMAAFRDGPVRRESEDVLDMLFRSYAGPKLVRRDGIVHKGRWYGTGDPRLVPMQGRRVLLAIQPDDAGRALVCELDRRPLFEIECIPISGMTEQQVRAMHRQRQSILKPYKQQARRGRDWLLQQNPSQIMRAQADQAMRDRPAPEPAPSLTIVRPELEAALEAAGPTPSEAASKAASKALRTGTDDDIRDYLEDDLPPAPSASARVVDLSDFLEELE